MNSPCTTKPFQIKDIQECLAEEVEHELSENLIATSIEEPDIVFGASEALSLAEACELLPSRHVADKLLSVLFSAHYLHIRKFWRCLQSLL